MGDYKDYSSYFVDGQCLFGGFPTQDQVCELAGMGVTNFVDLTFPNEVPTKYKLPHGCFYLNYPIPDRSIPTSVSEFASIVMRVHNTIVAGKKMYIHCRGGHGRSGILVAILIYMLTPDINTIKAIELATEYHSNRKIMREKWRLIGAPQTFYQKKYVHKFFSDIVFFRAYRSGSTTGFSNYSFHDVEVKERDGFLPVGVFPTSEALFQASKQPDNESFVLRQIHAKNPKISKCIGVKIVPDENWGREQAIIMEKIIHLKFEQHPQILQNLTRCGLRNIIYNSRRDDYFGVGPLNNGRNLLGKILMKIRNKYYLEFAPAWISASEYLNINGPCIK